MRRLYVSDEAYRRLKIRSINKGEKMIDLVSTIIMATLDEKGEYKRIALEPELEKRLKEWSNSMNITENELIWRMIRTVSLLYDERLKLADVLNIPRLEEIISKKEKQ